MKEVLKKTVGIIAAAALSVSCVPALAYTHGTAYVDNKFSTDGNFESWEKAYSDAGQVDTFEVKDGMLHYTTSAAGNGINKEPGALLLLNGGNGVTYNEGKRLELKFRIRKQSGTADLHVKLDLKNSSGMNSWLCDGWRGQNDLLTINGEGLKIKTGNGALGGSASAYSTYNTLVSGDMSGKDIDVSAYLDGINRKADYIVSVDGKVYKLSDCTWASYADGIHKLTEGKMDSIAFVSDNKNNSEKTTDDVYIDSVSLREIDDGSLYDDFSDKTAQGWIANPSGKQTDIDITDSGELHFTCQDAGVNNSITGGVIRPVNGLSGVAFEDGAVRVLKFRVKKAAGADLRIITDAPVDATRITGHDSWLANGNDWRSPLVFMQVTDSNVKVKNGNNSHPYTTYDEYSIDTADEWIDFTAYYDGTTKKASYILEVGGKTYTGKDKDWSYASGYFNKASEGNWATLAFLSHANGDKVSSEAWIDDVSVKKADTLFEDTFDTADSNWATVTAESALTNMEIKNGKLHYTSQNAGGGMADLAGVIRPINGTVGLSYDADSRYVMEFRVNKATAGADLLIKTDKNPFAGSGHEDANKMGFRGTLDLMRVCDNSIWIKDGNGMIEGFESSDLTKTQVSKWKKIDVSTIGKDIDVTAVIDGVNRLANYYITIDGEQYAFNNCDWSDYYEAWIKHTENFTSLAFVSQKTGDAQIADVYISNVSLSKTTAQKEASVLLWNDMPVTSLTAGQSVGALYKIVSGIEGFGKFNVILTGYVVDEDGILNADQVKIVPIDTGSAVGEISAPIDEAITVPEGKKYVVKAFLWEEGTQRPMTQSAEAFTE